MKQSISDLIGQTVQHKVFGNCLVLEVVDAENGKFTGKVLQDDVVKKFIFSAQFFKNVESYLTVDVVYKKPHDKTKKYKELDSKKFRNHPFVKAIDNREAKYSNTENRTVYDADEEEE